MGVDISVHDKFPQIGTMQVYSILCIVGKYFLIQLRKKSDSSVCMIDFFPID